MTPNDLITLALKQAGAFGVGQTPLAEDMNDAFTLLNMMLGQWNRKRWLIYHLLDVPFQATGAETYTIGPGGDLAYAVRPDRLEGAYSRLVTGGVVDGGLRDWSRDFSPDFGEGSPSPPPNSPTDAVGIDYPLRVIQSFEDYSAIAFKSLGSGGSPGFPQAIFYDPGFPRGTLYIWPIPSGSYEIHLLLKEELTQFPNLTTAINLPPEYLEALVYNLAVRLWDHYEMPPRPQTSALAKAALNTIRTANAAIPLLGVPDALSRAGGAYNIYADSGT